MLQMLHSSLESDEFLKTTGARKMEDENPEEPDVDVRIILKLIVKNRVVGRELNSC